MATTADTSDKSQMAKASDATDSARIGWAFLSQYYSYLNKDPARLHCFYTKRSTLIHSTEGEETVACYGQQEIHAKIMSLAFEDCKVYISNVDSQSSAEGGIIVQVIGEMSNSNGAWRKFAQTFFLAEQPNGYFVLNDICRYIKEEGDEDVTPAPASTSAQPEQSSSSPAPVPSASPSNDNAPTSVKSVLFNDVKPAQDLVKEEESTTVASSEPATAESSFTFGSEAVAAQPNGKDAATVNGDAEKVEEPAAAVEVEPLTEVEHKSNEAPPPLIEEPAPPAPVVEEVKKADKEEEIAESVAPVESKAPVESAPSEPTPPTPQASSSPAPASTPAPASPAVSAPAPAPTPAAPAAPKSWASLAASNTNKWGSMASASKGASAAPQKQAEPSTPSAPTPSASNTTAPSSSSAQPPSNFTEQVQAVVHSNCFVKGVVEFVTEKQLREVLTSRFGPLKELDIIRSKACAFVEFINLNDARKAIQVSMRHQDGGENGITFETSTGDKARINVVERKPHNERPPPRPRQAGEGAGGSSAQGQGKGQGGQQQKDGQGQRSGGQGGRGGANSGRNQGNRGGRTGGGGGSRQGSGQTQQQKQ